MSLTVVILAAGDGTRMKSRRPKVLHTVAGDSLLGHVCRTAAALAPQQVIAVVGYEAEAVREAFHARWTALCPHVPATVVVQTERRGTAHALRTTENVLQDATGTLLVLSGDVPLLRAETLRRLLATHSETGAAATVLSTTMAVPTGYGRVLRRADGGFDRVVEERDATPEEKAVTEINAGVYAFQFDGLFDILARVSNNNAQGEYYLPDALALLRAAGSPVEVVHHPDAEEVRGVNTRAELAAVAEAFRRRKVAELMAAGVTFLDPATAYVEADVRIGMDTVVYPNVHLEGETVIGENCRIHPGARLVNARLGNDVTVRDYSLVFDSRLDDRTSVGPFAHLRMNAHLHEAAVVGNFVEVKQSSLGTGTKAMHLSYLGDATLGAQVNIGAGTITCNYDGKQKHRTIIEDGVKVGSDTMLVAPVRVGARAMTGAGAVVTEDVPPDTLVVGVPAKVKKVLT
ncbi:MAG: bifunctional UDP-N-acetylglucosamine diphosphorylase/glucosamine-1-phosphate N-acetyltransferase GlmU [Chloracidobacterium sp.]|nr:bifunctional UDP-N-acetylglucosamine diphosphorylase/glucosamine-1-phosphate N-acetyltransferase GlmU [Chloracidobacterium sp.]MDW8216329.1 bifunctional UDP-N-acetylglucosamine diphosphorylase/glucosamine-1-phosphate N-acetyltransferase GlmU [Acidobacteriota bacterium]